MDNGFYKLGVSNSPEFRERTLQAQEPDVQLLATVPGNKELEQKLHRDFAEHRVRGEWFSFSGLVLWGIAAVFDVPVTVVDPPTNSFQVRNYIVQIHRYARQSISTRFFEKDSKRLELEIPYLLSASEAGIELEAEGVAWEIELEWQHQHLRTAFRVIQFLEYNLSNSLQVRLLELRCFATAEVRGYYVDAQSYGGRFYLEKREAEIYFNRMKKCFDVYHRPVTNDQNF